MMVAYGRGNRKVNYRSMKEAVLDTESVLNNKKLNIALWLLLVFVILMIFTEIWLFNPSFY